MRNQVFEKGNKLPYTNAGETTISAGTAIVVGAMLGIAIGDIPASKSGTLELEGVFTLAKASGSLTAGQVVFWDSVAKELVAAPTADALVPCLVFEASSGTTVAVKINCATAVPAAAVAALAQTVSGTYSQAEVQAISTKVDAVIAALKGAGLMKA